MRYQLEDALYVIEQGNFLIGNERSGADKFL